jgi:uncharacterized protein (TIGR02099 family)
LENTFFHKSGQILWTVLGWLLVLLAIYLALGRLFIFQLHQYKDPILQELNIRSPLNMEAVSVSGEWRLFSPIIVLKGLTLSWPGQQQNAVELTEGQVGVDVWNSAWSGTLQVSHVVFEGLTVNGELSSDGRFNLLGFGRNREGMSGEASAWLQELLLNARYFALQENTLRLRLPSGEVRELDLNLLLLRKGSNRRLEATLGSSRGIEITALANGLGNPFIPEQFKGDLYVDIQTPNMGAAKDLAPGGDPAIWADGNLEVEFWLSRDKGKTEIETRVEARDMLVSPREGEWSVPLQRLAFQAQVTESAGRWTLYTSELELQSNDTELYLPRMQMDAWGKAVRLRAGDLELAAISEFALSFDSMPDNVAALISELNPRGSLPAIQLNFSSFDSAGADWEATANFESLALESYRGAPGTSSARGYVTLGPGAANVIFDTRDFDLSFPNIYHEPLLFDQVYGSLDVNWDSDYVSLSSGLLTAEAEEGVLQALFGLDIPLVKNEVGVEMELLVGLKGADVKYRSKYIPYTLSESLRDWLDASIGEGEIAQGAFMWRGALKASQPTRRTVQLAFNVNDTALDYHPDWPPVTVDSAAIVIDDGRVKAASNSASVLESKANDVRVQTYPGPNRTVELAVQAVVESPASDGLYLINHSPLTTIIGAAFSEWTMAAGHLETNLELNLLLGPEPPPPEVNVSTQWTGVDVSITPGNLPLKNVAGNFDYSTKAGFSSSGMQALLWGDKVRLGLSQYHRGKKGYNPKSSTLTVSAEGEVDMEDVQNWLLLQPLKIAQGRTTVNAGIYIEPGESPLLTVQSDLVGVSLDLPQPWRKSGETPSAMLLTMDLGNRDRPVLLNIEDDLKLSLELGDGILSRGGLGIGVPAPAAGPSEFRVTGTAPHIAGDDLLDFVSEYLPYSEFTSVDTSSAPAPPDTRGLDSTDGSRPFRVVVEQLTADTMSFKGQEVADATLDLALSGPELEATLDSNWVGGQLLWRLDGERSSVALEFIDLTHFYTEEDVGPEGPVEGVDPTEGDELAEGEDPAEVEELAASIAQEPEGKEPDGGESREGEGSEQAPDLQSLELPDMDVRIASIREGERHLGELAFEMLTNGDTLTLEGITGEFAALTFAPENPARVVWKQGEDAYTEVLATLAFKDFGSTLSYFGYQKIIQTRKGSIDVKLHWPGAPTSFSLESARGSILLDVGSGSFLNAPGGAAGALRVVNILNLVHLVQRLSVSHMFDTGIPFDKVEGEIYLHEGTIEVPVMRVKGGSSFQFSGVSEVAEQSLTGEMVATLPVAKNLPWVAALAASLPVAAGVYVVSKIFDKQVNRFSSAVYTIDGTWNEPEVKFSRIFDDTSGKFHGLSTIDPNDISLPSEQDDIVQDPNAPLAEVSAVEEEQGPLAEGQSTESADMESGHNSAGDGGALPSFEYFGSEQPGIADPENGAADQAVVHQPSPGQGAAENFQVIVTSEGESTQSNLLQPRDPNQAQLIE